MVQHESKQPDSSHLLRAIDRLTSNARVLYVAAIRRREHRLVVAGRSRPRSCRVPVAHAPAKEAKTCLVQNSRRCWGSFAHRNFSRRAALMERTVLRPRTRLWLLEDREETLIDLGKEQALGDVVWAIRRFEPDVHRDPFSPEDREITTSHSVGNSGAGGIQRAADRRLIPSSSSISRSGRHAASCGTRGIRSPKRSAGRIPASRHWRI